MCGIAGIIHPRGSGPDRAVLAEMIAAIEHRGPDENGIYIDGEAGLAHARLSILDLAGGRQPMRLAEEDLCITYNGEIFNYLELRSEMSSRGVPFATRSDTEVVLRSFQQHGPECLQDFYGQWAFGIWDGRQRELFLARDRVGIRPLYYTIVNGTFLFASEMKALLCHPLVSRRLDLQCLEQIFTCWHPIGERTILQDIRSLPPGCSLRFRDGRVTVHRYWSFGFPDEVTQQPIDELSQQLRELLIDAVRIRLRADVPVGAYLSGGIDSTAVTALIKHYTQNPLRTFSVTFAHREFDESSFQQRASDHLQTEHCAAFCSDQQIGDVFPQVIWHAEAPLVRTAPAPLYCLSQLVRDSDYKVVLTGEGADEILGGYDIFKETKIRRFWAAARDSAWRPLLLRRLYPYLDNLQRLTPAYLERFYRVDPVAVASPFFSHLPRWDMTGGLKVFLSDNVLSALRGYDVQAEWQAALPADFARWPAFCQAQYLEATGLMPGYILSSQGDRMAMGHSVEGRFPFLDYRVIEFASRLPTKWKMRGLNEKYILKRAVSDLLPTEVLRRSKQPYRAPDAISFLRGPDGPRAPDYVDDLLAPDRIRQYGLFREDAVSKLVQKGRQGRLQGVRDNMAFVAILSTQLLVHQFIEHPGKMESYERIHAN
jgi:asparagine synthase (glutamine-hydrolysing)